MKKETFFKGKYNTYFSWPAILSVLWTGAVIWLFFINRKAGAAALAFLLVQIAVSVFLYRYGRKNVAYEMINFAACYDRMEKDLLMDFALPFAFLDKDGTVLWTNELFTESISADNPIGKNISRIIPELVKSELPKKEKRTELSFIYQDAHYRAEMQKTDVRQLAEGQKLVETDEADYLIALYICDESELYRQYRINEENKIVVGIIAIDNYDEALENVEEVRRSLLLALIDRRVNKYFSEHDGVLKKVDNEHYFFVVRKTKYEEMRDEKFSLIEDVKDVKIGNEMSVTLSMGLGLNQGSFTKDSEAAQAAIDMALARGGDQVIVRDNEKVTFFGGRTGAVEKYTRVKARVKAHALREIISTKERVVIMGHKITDVDALGAAIGIYRAAKTLGKPAFIVIDRNSRSIQPIIAEFSGKQEYEQGLFIDRTRAKELVDGDTVLVIVDTNRPSYTECRELLDKTEAIVVLDHHRQGEEVIKNARLSYIEPYASSACEMASEILQYFDEEVKLKSVEADCMYAGIMVDTNNFNMRTGVRTFEAAAYLRRSGADMTRVRKMFREDLQDYTAKAKTISQAELFMDSFAISICPSEGLSSPTIVCAQAANELLGIVGVRASFVLTEYNDLVYVSARAIDEVNVQLIMERLGGGGHINMAGTQFEGLSLDEVRDLIKKTIREMSEEGDI
ncbi:MAG: DHH family phosphoesterase [Lachnospiraceae bacterium]|nr:DHH family phosphoesterase [Lachnospiraceae bacterium]